MKKFLLLSIIPLLVFSFTGFSQTTEEKNVITKDYNIKKLNELAKSLKTKAELEKAEALKLAKQNGWPVRYEEDGKLFELMKVSKEGLPVYYTTFNINAAKSTRANTLYNGGILGLNIEGQNMEAHVWDGGLALITHQEYDGAGGNNRFSIGDGTTALHYHSAHVTGTIIASGVVANAKGMAPQADAIGYDWFNDMSEATTAAGNGMLLSNHSYGWGASDLPDWYFGAYLSESRDWDNILYNAPYYLMVVAAGNDGNDNTSNGDPLDGNSSYDKLSGHTTSKNNLVVANAQDANIDANGNLISVNINTGSSEGPCDDYRIKPDITGNGTSLYSTDKDNNSDYLTISGTSMASPNVCGTLLQLQQHYNNLNSGFMRAATLKGLALHTADDAGPAGPDAVWGWGLLNGKEAANVITNNGGKSLISELTLNNGGSYSINVVSDDINDLIASISWTDPAGTANTGTTNDPTPALVNDLDIRVTKGGSTYYPYRLVNITTNGTGDNIVDPFEKIIVSGASGTYTITVTHKGNLSSGSQAYSMIISGIDTNPKTWTGTSSTDWNTPGNWSENTVASMGDNVFIPAVATNWPTYTGNLTLGTTCGNITMEGASELIVTGDLSISSGKTFYVDPTGNPGIKVAGNWTNNGTFNSGQSTVIMNGTANSTITGPSGTMTAFYDGFEGTNNWTLSGEFEIGAPGGLGGEHGNADPTSAYLGSNVLGVDLTGTGTYPGDYEINLSDRAYQAISPTINCTGFTNVSMNFQRWLNVERDQYDNAYIDISNTNGSSWNNIWENGIATIEDASWGLQTIDISSFADNQAEVKIRFCIGSTDGSWQFCGWNIDEFQIEGYTQLQTGFFNLEISKSNAAVSTNSDINVDGVLTIKPNATFTVGTGNNVYIAD